MVYAHLIKIWCLAIAVSAFCQELPPGEVIPSVKCQADATQSYALYLPSRYTSDSAWSVLFLFDAGGRGRRGVERYQEAAERFGYIVAGSNNSRNGPWDVSLAAAQAMTSDVTLRFAIDNRRVYAGGMSGGARVAAGLAVGSGMFAGVILSSAGFADSRPRKLVPFAVFGTAGTEDFNYSEMREVDRVLTTPHRVRIFEGGHTWLPSEMAIEALEWMEVQAMKAGRRARDEALLNQIFAARLAKANTAKDNVAAFHLFSTLAEDFHGLRDVIELAARAASLARQKDVKDSLKKERAEDEREIQFRRECEQLIAGLRADDIAVRHTNLLALKDKLTALAKQSKLPDDSSPRRTARRVLAGLSTETRGMNDPDLRKIMEQVRPQNSFGQ